MSEGLPPGGPPQRRASDRNKGILSTIRDGLDTAKILGAMLFGAAGLIIAVTLWYASNGSTLKDHTTQLGLLSPRVDKLEAGIQANSVEITRLQQDFKTFSGQTHDTFTSIDQRLNNDKKQSQEWHDAAQQDRREMDAADAILRSDIAVIVERVRGLVDRQPPLSLTLPSSTGRPQR